MRVLAKCLVAFLCCALTAFAMPPAADAADLVVASGDPKGVYYEVAEAMAKVVNKYAKLDGDRLVVLATQGSTENLELLHSGKVQFALVQSDRIWEAWYGKGHWKGKTPFKELRSLFPIYKEPINIVVSSKCGAEDISSLKGKRVVVGSPGSGTYHNVLDVLNVYGMSMKDFKQALQVNLSKGVDLMLAGKADALFFTGGHPNDLLMKLAKGPFKVFFVGVDECSKLQKHFPYYIDAWFLQDHYPVERLGDSVQLKTCGVYAYMMTTDKVPPRVVKAVAGELYLHFNEFKQKHRVTRYMNRYGFFSNKYALVAPFYPGLKKYYKKLR